jgi:hypothetical protein
MSLIYQIIIRCTVISADKDTGAVLVFGVKE